MSETAWDYVTEHYPRPTACRYIWKEGEPCELPFGHDGHHTSKSFRRAFPDTPGNGWSHLYKADSKPQHVLELEAWQTRQELHQRDMRERAQHDYA